MPEDKNKKRDWQAKDPLDFTKRGEMKKPDLSKKKDKIFKEPVQMKKEHKKLDFTKKQGTKPPNLKAKYEKKSGKK